MKQRRWAVFISGQGSNLRALLQWTASEKIALVVSSRETANGISFAKRWAAPVIHFSNDWDKLDKLLKEYRVTDIFLAGFMKIVPPDFVQLWKNRIFNLHPSLLPAYPGLNSIQRAFEEQAEMGVTIHCVDEGVDTGKVLLQKSIGQPKEGDTFSLFWQKIRLVEQELCVRFLNSSEVRL